MDILALLGEDAGL
jgi:hypothetical protein